MLGIKVKCTSYFIFWKSFGLYIAIVLLYDDIAILTIVWIICCHRSILLYWYSQLFLSNWIKCSCHFSCWRYLGYEFYIAIVLLCRHSVIKCCHCVTLMLIPLAIIFHSKLNGKAIFILKAIWSLYCISP